MSKLILRYDRNSEKSRVPLLTDIQLRNLLEELGMDEIGSSVPESRSSKRSLKIILYIGISISTMTMVMSSYIIKVKN